MKVVNDGLVNDNSQIENDFLLSETEHYSLYLIKLISIPPEWNLKQ